MVAAPLLEDYERYLALCAENDPDMYKQLQRAIHTVDSVVTLVGERALALSYNGGKDAAAAMHILRLVLMRRAGNAEEEVLASVKVLFFDTTDEFVDVQEHVEAMAELYSLTFIKYDCPYKDGMQDLVDNHGVKAVVMGVRMGDPFTADAEHITPSTLGWPVFLRVYPILLWDYGSVWKFLRSCRIPYCTLYDQGYTSIGKVHNTVKNRALLRSGTEDEYLPAYELADYSLERANRSTTSTDSRHTFQRIPTMSGDTVRVGVVVIGDEILSGQVQDQNLPYLCRELDEVGAEVAEACVLPDDQCAIAEHVRRLSTLCDYVITTGGIGPTHDDVTFNGVAQAFHVHIEQNGAMKEVLLRNHGDHPKYSKFAQLPTGAQLSEADGVRYPIIRVRNIFCLPGVPELMKEQFEALRVKFTCKPLFRQHVQLGRDEVDIAHVLQDVQQKFQSVKIGSYPVDVPASAPDDETTLKRVRVTIQGREEASVAAASRELDMLLSNNSYA